LIYTHCEEQGYVTGYDFSTAGTTSTRAKKTSGCALALQKKDAQYYATLAPRLIQQLIVDKTINIATLSEDNSICRSIHVILAQIDPATHCPHVALDSTYCITTTAA
jgi:hypothetical protein